MILAFDVTSGDLLMNDANQKAHWETVYTTKGENEVSWFQENPAPSLELIDLARPTPESAIVDIGGGASRLVDSLVAHGYTRVTVLDISEAALEAAKASRRHDHSTPWKSAQRFQFCIFRRPA